MEASGHRVVRTESAWWYEAHPRWFLAIPFYTELRPSAVELKHVLGQGAWVLRYTCLTSAGTASYRSTCDDTVSGQHVDHVEIADTGVVETLVSDLDTVLTHDADSETVLMRVDAPTGNVMMNSCWK